MIARSGLRPSLLALALLAAATAALAANIDPADRFAWGENVGWVNFAPAQGPGVTVTASGLKGFAWAENIGWINLAPSGGGVFNDGQGNLSGFAWGENVGWINFAPTGGGYASRRTACSSATPGARTSAGSH